MKISGKMIKHVVIGFVAFIFLVGTLFIKQPGELPTRYVHLGYPIHFYTLDFSGNQESTHISGAPDWVIAEGRYDILSAWEEFGQINWPNFILSYLIIFFTTEILVMAIDRSRLQTSKK